MRKLLLYVFLVSSLPFTVRADETAQVRKAVERVTLNQPGTKPFHLKAVISPSFDRDKDSGRTGEVEIWWQSPDKWRREVQSPAFHQVQVINGQKRWQKTDGEYFPEWLRETAEELITPIPSLPEVLQQVKTAEKRQMMGQVNISWTQDTGTPEAHNIQRFTIALQQASERLLYTYGFGWNGEFKDYEDFHGRQVARTLNVGTPQVTAKVVTLEDLGAVAADFFDPDPRTGDAQLLDTELITEVALRKNLESMPAVQWPAVQDGPLTGNVTAWILVDREGKVRELDGIVSENSAMKDTGKQAIMNMRFTPFTLDSRPVQVYAQVTIPFKTTRSAGTETFDTAAHYFEHGAKLSFASGAAAPYVEEAEFQFVGQGGKVETGHYEDTWLNDEHWLRTAIVDHDQCERSRNGEIRYRNTQGTQSGLLCLVLKLIEPIPALDTMTESDWRVRRDVSTGMSTVKVLTGYESADGKLDSGARAYWFSDSGVLVRSYSAGLETQRSEFQDFHGIKLARRIDVLKNGQLVMRIRVKDIKAPDGSSPKMFVLKGHEWQRAFTDEAR